MTVAADEKECQHLPCLVVHSLLSMTRIRSASDIRCGSCTPFVPCCPAALSRLHLLERQFPQSSYREPFCVALLDQDSIKIASESPWAAPRRQLHATSGSSPAWNGQDAQAVLVWAQLRKETGRPLGPCSPQYGHTGPMGGKFARAETHCNCGSTPHLYGV